METLIRVSVDKLQSLNPPQPADHWVPTGAVLLHQLSNSLQAFAKIDARRAQVVELRFFGGLSVEEVAAALQVSPQTVMRAWLARALSVS